MWVICLYRLLIIIRNIIDLDSLFKIVYHLMCTANFTIVLLCEYDVGCHPPVLFWKHHDTYTLKHLNLDMTRTTHTSDIMNNCNKRTTFNIMMHRRLSSLYYSFLSTRSNTIEVQQMQATKTLHMYIHRIMLRTVETTVRNLQHQLHQIPPYLFFIGSFFYTRSLLKCFLYGRFTSKDQKLRSSLETREFLKVPTILIPLLLFF